MTPEQHKKLRAPFPAAAIGKLPKPTARDNTKGRCSECGGWHGLPAVHLDYVGHAAITDRLLEVDPDWTWAPMAVGPNGEPLLTNGGLWIKLTVCGVTRPGFGDETNGKGMKETIGDALRNAAMRFGVGLDLWSKEDLSGDESAPPKEAPKVTTASAPTVEAEIREQFQSPVSNGSLITEPQQKRLFAISKKNSLDEDTVKRIIKDIAGVDSSAEIPKAKYDAVIEAIEVEGVPF